MFIYASISIHPLFDFSKFFKLSAFSHLFNSVDVLFTFCHTVTIAWRKEWFIYINNAINIMRTIEYTCWAACKTIPSKVNDLNPSNLIWNMNLYFNVKMSAFDFASSDFCITSPAHVKPIDWISPNGITRKFWTGQGIIISSLEHTFNRHWI